MKNYDGLNTRAQWVATMHQIAYPIIYNMANNTLKEVLPLDNAAEKASKVAYLEAIGRTVNGLAPWLELKDSCIFDEEEKKLQAQYRNLTRLAMANAVDENAKDYCIWNKTGKYMMPHQSVVDAAYFASAIMKAPRELWQLQPQNVKQNILKAFDLVLLQKPNRSNWLMFTAMIETCKFMLTGTADAMRVEYAVSKHFEWYKGDGVYGDGELFSWDYYNSYVIQPMLEEVTRVGKHMLGGQAEKFRLQVARSIKRYSEIQERMIAPDGSYPFLGRSITYRTAAFSALAHTAYRGMLPKTLAPNQVRCALDKTIKKMLSAETLFDSKGFLTKGLFGKQPKLANYYTNTGSLYICLAVFLPLGLSAKNKFWASNNAPTTWEKIWSGENMNDDEKLEMRKKI
ncbi:MAG: DUF2264 domain-containing protein [Clostridia bacterium]